MPTFSKTSQSNLDSCHPDLKLIFETIIKDHDITIVCGHRGEEAQAQAFNSGASQVSFPNSYHNKTPSMAADVAPCFPDGIHWEDLGAFYMLAGIALEVARRLLEEGRITHELIYGGDWDGDRQTADQTFKDLPHYQLATPR